MTRKRFAFAGALQLVALLSLHVASPALAAFSAAELKCRDTIAKLGAKLGETAAKAFNDCHAKRIAGTIPQGTVCNSVVDADLNLAGTPLPEVLPAGRAVLRDGTWKVSLSDGTLDKVAEVTYVGELVVGE